MAKKKAALTEDQKGILKKKGLNPYFTEILQDLQFSMIVKNKITGEMQVIEK